MKSAICIINGKGGVGKDTLIQAIEKQENCEVLNVSSIDPIKDMLVNVTRGCEKDLAQRKLLADIKQRVDEYYSSNHSISYTQNYLRNYVRLFINNYKSAGDGYNNDMTYVMFVHIREPENIAKFLEIAKTELCLERDEDTVLTTLLVQSDRAQENYGNKADDLVDEYDYDLIYTSKGGKETDAKNFREFFNGCVFDSLDKQTDTLLFSCEGLKRTDEVHTAKDFLEQKTDDMSNCILIKTNLKECLQRTYLLSYINNRVTTPYKSYDYLMQEPTLEGQVYAVYNNRMKHFELRAHIKCGNVGLDNDYLIPLSRQEEQSRLDKKCTVFLEKRLENVKDKNKNISIERN